MFEIYFKMSALAFSFSQLLKLIIKPLWSMYRRPFPEFILNQNWTSRMLTSLISCGVCLSIFELFIYTVCLTRIRSDFESTYTQDRLFACLFKLIFIMEAMCQTNNSTILYANAQMYYYLWVIPLGIDWRMSLWFRKKNVRKIVSKVYWSESQGT